MSATARSLYAVAGALAAAAVVLGACERAAGPGAAPAGTPAPLGFRATATVAPQYFRPDRAIQPLVLPAAAGGSGALTYSLSPPVPGLTFDAGARTLTGAPTRIGEYAMTYAARDRAGAAARLTFTITVENTLRRGAGDQVFFLNPAGKAIDQVEYTLRLGESPADVYLIATHGGDTPEPLGKVVKLVDTAAGPAAADRARTASLRAQPRPPSEPAPDLPWVTEHNNNPPLLVRGSASRSQSAQGAQPQDPVGSSVTITEVLDAGGDHQTITLDRRAQATDGVTTVNVYVDRRAWGCGAPQCVNRALVYAIANRFLRPGPANDIYDWVTAIYGAPWGPHEHANLIPPSAADTINIMLYDIDGDGYPAGPEDTARVSGFFHSYHNYPRAGNPPSYRNSFERLAIFLDSPVLTLDLDISISTLAHELQHMIHFYQKPVLRGAASEKWLNEMASEVAEDLVARQSRVNGPRGVGYDDPTAGRPGNRSGSRLPWYNLYNDIQVTAWDGLRANYAINYALGAYLARNYGGAELFSRIVRSERAGVDAIEGALRELGHQVSFSRILANWAVAGLLSDNTLAPVPYRYNSGTWSASGVGGAAYRLGSINLYNYPRPGGDEAGPYLLDLSEFSARTQPLHSNKYAALGRLSGSRTLTVTAPAGLRFTVMFKE